MGDTADMASEGEAVLDEETIHSNAENDTEATRLTPAEQAELRIRIAHQVASALQDPRVGRVGFDASTSGSWTSLLTYAGVPGLSSTASFSYVEQTPPPIQPGVLPEVLLSDFDPYLRRTRDSRQEFFESLRGTRRVGSEEHEDHWDTSTSGADDSDAFGISKTIEQTIITSPDDASEDDPLRQVPSLFFREEFSLADPSVFTEICGDAYAPDNTFVNLGARAVLGSNYSQESAQKAKELDSQEKLQDTLAKHLDVVEHRLTSAVEQRADEFHTAAVEINKLVASVDDARVVCATARNCTGNAMEVTQELKTSVSGKHTMRNNLGTLLENLKVLQKIREARVDLAALVDAEEHTGALELCDEIRNIKSRAVNDEGVRQNILSGITCVGSSLDESLSSVEKMCAGAVCKQWVASARLPSGATASVSGSGAPAPESHLAIVGAAARDAGLASPDAGEWDLSDDGEDDENIYGKSHSRTDRSAEWGESRDGLGPDERSVYDAAENLYPRLTRALRCSNISDTCHASSSNGGVAQDAMRAWSDAAATDVRFAMRRALRAALRAAGVATGADNRKGHGKGNIPNLPDRVFNLVLETVAAAAREHFSRCAMCVLWTKQTLGVGGLDANIEKTQNGHRNGLPKVDSFGSVASSASETELDSSDLYSQLVTQFVLDASDTRVEALLSHASETASALPPNKRAAIASAAAETARLVTDAAAKTFAEMLEETADVRSESNNSSWSWHAPRDHFSVIDACVSFLRVSEGLGRRKCLSLRSAVARTSKMWLATRHLAATKELTKRLDDETWTRFDEVDGETKSAVEELFAIVDGSGSDNASNNTSNDTSHDSSQIRSSLFLARVVNEYFGLAKCQPSLAPDISRHVSELTRTFNARSCRLVLGAEAMTAFRKNQLKSVTAKHLVTTHGSVKFVRSVVVDAALHFLSPLMPSQARRDSWESEISLRVKKDLDTHCFEIRQKLVHIMRERCAAHVVDVKKVSTGDNTDGNTLMEIVSGASSELGTIGRVVGESLSREDCSEVFTKIASVFDDAFQLALTELSDDGNKTSKNDIDSAASVIANALSQLTGVDVSDAAPKLTTRLDTHTSAGRD